MEKLKVKILSSYHGAAFETCSEIVSRMCEITNENPDLLVCPDYDIIIPPHELAAVPHGALIFHPSPLPRMKGRDAIKRQYKAGDKVGGGTWFWANYGVDDGDICEQEVCKINLDVRPRDYYKNTILPIMADSLKRALSGIESGNIRKIKQRV